MTSLFLLIRAHRGPGVRPQRPVAGSGWRAAVQPGQRGGLGAQRGRDRQPRGAAWKRAAWCALSFSTFWNCVDPSLVFSPSRTQGRSPPRCSRSWEMPVGSGRARRVERAPAPASPACSLTTWRSELCRAGSGRSDAPS